MGNLLVLAYAASRFGTLWAASVVIVSLSVAFYAAIGMLEGAMLKRSCAPRRGDAWARFALPTLQHRPTHIARDMRLS